MTRPDKHNRRSIRLKHYDYTKPGYYFVTICSIYRECIFGNVGAGLASVLISLTDVGKIIDQNWNDIPNQYEHIFIDQYIIMPNHIHGIIIIGEKRADARPAPTTVIGDIICSFKSRCVNDNLKRIRENNSNEIGKIWQRNYYEHIIRNDQELEKIREYIALNPLKWYEDKYNPLNKKELTSHST